MGKINIKDQGSPPTAPDSGIWLYCISGKMYGIDSASVIKNFTDTLSSAGGTLTGELSVLVANNSLPLLKLRYTGTPADQRALLISDSANAEVMRIGLGGAIISASANEIQGYTTFKDVAGNICLTFTGGVSAAGILFTGTTIASNGSSATKLSLIGGNASSPDGQIDIYYSAPVAEPETTIQALKASNLGATHNIRIIGNNGGNVILGDSSTPKIRLGAAGILFTDAASNLPLLGFGGGDVNYVHISGGTSNGPIITVAGTNSNSNLIIKAPGTGLLDFQSNPQLTASVPGIMLNSTIPWLRFSSLGGFVTNFPEMNVTASGTALFFGVSAASGDTNVALEIRTKGSGTLKLVAGNLSAYGVITNDGNAELKSVAPGATNNSLLSDGTQWVSGPLGLDVVEAASAVTPIVDGTVTFDTVALNTSIAITTKLGVITSIVVT